MNFILAMLCCVVFGGHFGGPEVAVIAEINAAREENRVPPLAVNWEAARLARYKSEEMVTLNFFGHESRLYGEPDEMLAHFGVPFSAAGVNIAKGQDCAKEVVQAWLSSSAHRENLLREDFTAAGVGLAYSDDIPYWTLFLISSVSVGTKNNDDAVLRVLRISERIDASCSLCKDRFFLSSGRGRAFSEMAVS